MHDEEDTGNHIRIDFAVRVRGSGNAQRRRDGHYMFPYIHKNKVRSSRTPQLDPKPNMVVRRQGFCSKDENVNDFKS